MNERSILSVISKAKDEMISPEEFERTSHGDLTRSKYAKAYTEYQKRLKASNAMDFDDLICKTVELFQLNKESSILLSEIASAILWWMSIRITNTVQFRFIHLLASGINGLWRQGV